MSICFNRRRQIAHVESRRLFNFVLVIIIIITTIVFTTSSTSSYLLMFNRWFIEINKKTMQKCKTEICIHRSNEIHRNDTACFRIKPSYSSSLCITTVAQPFDAYPSWSHHSVEAELLIFGRQQWRRHWRRRRRWRCKSCETGIDHADIAAVDDDCADEAARRELITLTLTLSTTMNL